VFAHPELATSTKIRILSLVARNLAELHMFNIVHADIKPANVLLGDEAAEVVHLADFGLSSILSADVVLAESSLRQTKLTNGTPLYCAPEMLVNPFDSTFNETVAKPSRKTDIYVFGLLCWQVLAQTAPFMGVRSAAALCAQVHSGTRPPLNLLPLDTPSEVVSLITACWAKDRSRRPTAETCAAILQTHNSLVNDIPYGSFLWHSDSGGGDERWAALRDFELAVCHYFNRQGVNMCSVGRAQDRILCLTPAVVATSRSGGMAVEIVVSSSTEGAGEGGDGYSSEGEGDFQLAARYTHVIVLGDASLEDPVLVRRLRRVRRSLKGSKVFVLQASEGSLALQGLRDLGIAPSRVVNVSFLVGMFASQADGGEEDDSGLRSQLLRETLNPLLNYTASRMAVVSVQRDSFC
jgi:hypothetical protein